MNTKPKTTIINHKKYTVTYRFLMVGNYIFTDRHGTEYLVDAEDVGEWLDGAGKTYKDGIDAAIAYAKDLAAGSPDGCFWWKVKNPTS